MYALKSHPWQCEIQICLQMPNFVLKNHNFTGFFSYHYSFKYMFLPSSRRQLHFLVDSKEVQDFKSIDLLNWLANFRFNTYGEQVFKTGCSSQNYVHIIGKLSCQLFIRTSFFSQRCHVSTLDVIRECVNCPSQILAARIVPPPLLFEYLPRKYVQTFIQ